MSRQAGGSEPAFHRAKAERGLFNPIRLIQSDMVSGTEDALSRLGGGSSRIC